MCFFLLLLFIYLFFLFFLSWKSCQLFAAAVVEYVMEANGLGPVGLLPREESDLGPCHVQCIVKFVLDFQSYMRTPVDCPSASYRFHKCNFEIIEVVWFSFRKLRE